MTVIKYSTSDTEFICLFRNLMAKPSMYNCVGVGGLQVHTLRIVLLLFMKRSQSYYTDLKDI